MYKYLDSINEPQDVKNIDTENLPVLCSEIRDFIIKSVNYTGGHLGSSLGCTELCVALHKVFNAPKDKIIFDIGHQSYAHKIITKRKDKFSTLRQEGGLSGFSCPQESEYDLFTGGHSSASLSQAIGLKMALEQQGDKSSVINIIGDAAIGSGVSLEAINHLGTLDSKVIVILNDNNMSISKTTGALSAYFSKIKFTDSYFYAKELTDKLLSKMPDVLTGLTSHVKRAIRSNSQSNLFEELGFSYYGPIDGHDVVSLVDILEHFKNHDYHKPILLHLITEKGKGADKLEQSKDCFHGVEGELNAIGTGVVKVANTKVCVDELIKLVQCDEKIICITAAMLHGTGLINLKNMYPNKVIDVGIAEQHAVSLASGLAKGGLKPFVCIYSTFMQRAYDQVIHDVNIDSLPVRFIMDRAGFVGADGYTHVGMFDYSMFGNLPNSVFMVPSCQTDIISMLHLMNNINNKPSFIRFSKEKYPVSSNLLVEEVIEIGKGKILKQGKKLAVIGLGEVLADVLSASKILLGDGIDITVVDARFLNPIDEKLIVEIANTHDYIVTIEESLGSVFGNKVLSVINNYKLLNKIKIHCACIPCKYIDQGSIEYQKKQAYISTEQIAEFIKDFLK